MYEDHAATIIMTRKFTKNICIVHFRWWMIFSNFKLTFFKYAILLNVKNDETVTRVHQKCNCKSNRHVTF